MAEPSPASCEACDRPRGRAASKALVCFTANDPHDPSVPVACDHRDAWLRGHVDKVVIGCGGDEAVQNFVR